MGNILRKKVFNISVWMILVPILLASTVAATAVIIFSNTIQTSVEVNGYDYYIEGAFTQPVTYGEINSESFDYLSLTGAKTGYLVLTFTHPNIGGLSTVIVDNVMVRVAGATTPTELGFWGLQHDVTTHKTTLVFSAQNMQAFDFGGVQNDFGSITFDTNYRISSTEPVDATIRISPTNPMSP